jgi:hypothetical protein
MNSKQVSDNKTDKQKRERETPAGPDEVDQVRIQRIARAQVGFLWLLAKATAARVARIRSRD